VRILIQLAGMVFYPLIVHLLIKLDATWLAVLGLVVTSVVYFILVLSIRRDTGSHWLWVGMYLVLGVLGSVNLFTDTHYALFIPPVAINLAIAAFFAWTLRPSATPLVEQMMRFEYQGAPPPAPVRRYARRLTRVWVAYFVTVAVVAGVLAAIAPLEVWSLFANVLNYVFAIVLVLLQYLYRFWRYRQYGVVMPWHTLRGMARLPWPGRDAPPLNDGPTPR
jgi:uncharacterized membrane protein